MLAVGCEMATANVVTDVVEDFVTCGVCLCEYDEEIRKPKFLPCSHTVCFLCLQEIRRGDTITCPFCRKIIAKEPISGEAEWILPNNTYALQIIKQNKKFAELTSSFAVSKIESLSGLKEELLKMRDTGVNKLALAIQKRKEVEVQVSHAIKFIQAAEEEAKKFLDENNLCLAELISTLEAKGSKDFSVDRKTAGNAEEDVVFSELLSLVDDSTSEDTAETLKQKMMTSVEFYNQKLTEATKVATEYEFRQKTKIQVHLFDESDRPIQTFPAFEKGFRSNQPSEIEPPTQQDLKLLSYVVFTLLQKQKIPLKNESQPIDKVTSDPWIKLPSHQSQELAHPRSIAHPRSNFRLNSSSKFILRIFRSGRPKGEIHFRPASTFHPKFVQQLGEFCYSSQRDFSCTISKATSEQFVLLSVHHPQFQPAVPSMINRRYNTVIANEENEIGLTLVTNSSGKVTGWSFFFLLEDSDNYNFPANPPEWILDNEHFGDVNNHHQTLNALKQLSRVNKSERAEYNFTLESE
ncbi:uncharacterized protein LOC124326148 [Daphnia pulicaria]|uniref:uncharacterized protein LOC124326148 n=1 Tax=Daphnia pulicaria TaxID=35523 RepID=UPI001EEBEE58|nr:uncharacterized protein LOC124326148 [Daphnia pulicaria]